jgi:sugar phosphate permease
VERYEEHKLRLADAAREANYGLWNALLTLDGVVISVFSAVAVFEAGLKWFVSVIVLASSVSAILVLLNFRSTRNLYRSLGMMNVDEVQKMTAQQQDEQIRRAGRKHDNCNLGSR